MAGSEVKYSTIDDWVAREAISFTLDSPANFAAAVDKLVAALGGEVELLGIGEPTHGADEFLVLRNRLFQRLVEAHGYSAIAIESSFTRGRVVDDYVAGRSVASYDDVKDTGFSHGFGAPAPNRELVEWMRNYNAEPSHRNKLRFYGFDSPTEMTGADSPRQPGLCDRVSRVGRSGDGPGVSCPDREPAWAGRGLGEPSGGF